MNLVIILLFLEKLEKKSESFFIANVNEIIAKYITFYVSNFEHHHKIHIRVYTYPLNFLKSISLKQKNNPTFSKKFWT